MAAAKYNLTIEQGSDFLIFLTLKDSSSAVRNLTGYQVRASMRPTVESSTSYDFTCGVTNPGTLGKVVLSLSSVQNRTIPAGIYVYDVEIHNDGTGGVERVIQGQVTLTREVTR